MRKVSTIQDVQIVLKELGQWKDRLSSKNQDFKGLKIQNAGDATEPGDYVTLRQLQTATSTNSQADQNYSIPFSSIGTVVVGQVAAPYIVGKDRVGTPTLISVAVPTKTQAPTGQALIVNLALNGTNLLVNNLQLPAGAEGPVSSSQFIAPMPILKVGDKLVPVIIQAGAAQFVTIQLYVKRILS